uniref:CCC motif membrane protein n=1 Tax=Flavobacterium sp. TaxID=239 RepID=UPI004049BBB5
MEKQKLSYATGVLILGILSVLSSCCYGIGLLFSIIALVLFSIDAKKYRMNPDLYDNYSTLNVGRILAIIGLVLSVLFITFIVWFIMQIGLENLQDQEAVQQAIEEMFGVKQ